MKVGVGLGSEGTLTGVLRVLACSRVLGNTLLENEIEILMLQDAMTGHLTGCSGAVLHNLLTSTSST